MILNRIFFPSYCSPTSHRAVFQLLPSFQKLNLFGLKYYFVKHFIRKGMDVWRDEWVSKDLAVAFLFSLSHSQDTQDYLRDLSAA